MPRRKRTLGSGIALALLVAVSGIVATPWSVARAADDDEQPKAAKSEEIAPQAEDTDRPKDKSLLEKGPVDTAKKAQVEEPAFYEKWQFWAITGGVVVGVVGLIWGGATLLHVLGGGDVRPCTKMTDPLGCFGQGESQ